MPLFTGDYLRDTAHLSCAENGIYLKLLMYCWDSKGPVPIDERKLCGIVNARSGDEVEALRRVIEEFFVRMDDGWYNERIQTEVVKSEILGKKRSEYGKLGGMIRARTQLRRAKAASVKQEFSLSQAKAKLDLVSPSPSPSPINTVSTLDAVVLNTAPSNQMLIGEKTGKTMARATRLPNLWDLPIEWRAWAKQTRPELSSNQVNNISDEFHDYWLAMPGQRGCKLDWFATWRNWIRRQRVITDKLSPFEEPWNDKVL